MSEFICKKPITLSGHSFSYGEVIPDGYVLPKRALALIRSNYIAEIDGAAVMESEAQNKTFQSENGETSITIPINTENGVLEAIMSSQTITTVFSIMQKTVEEAEKDISELEDEDALVVLNAVDSRKGIKKAAEDRHLQLNSNRGQTESGAEVQKTGDA